MRVVHPAYHSRDGNGGHGSLLESGNRRLSCDLVFANSNGYVMALRGRGQKKRSAPFTAESTQMCKSPLTNLNRASRRSCYD